jgi:hypothetical protein
MSAYKIDKSLFDENDLKDWERLVAKGMVQVDPADEPHVDPAPAAAPVVEKAAPVEFEVPDFVKDAIAKSEKFIEEQEKKEMVDLAKKYDILGQKPEELGKQLYELKKSNEATFNTCIAMLDSQVALIEKSPLFAEIGKSGHTGGDYNGLHGAEAKADAKAKEIMKADPNMSYTAAIAKAWEDPELAAEYDAEYNGK